MYSVDTPGLVMWIELRGGKPAKAEINGNTLLLSHFFFFSLPAFLLELFRGFSLVPFIF
jgi:hypothetical protein